MAHWRLSLWERQRGGGEQSPPFYCANFNTSQNHLWQHHCLPRCELPSALCRPRKTSRSDRGWRASRWTYSWEYFCGSLAEHLTHRIQCCSSVLSDTHTPLTLLKCTLTQLRLFLSIILHLCLPLTLGSVNAGDQQSCTSLRYQKGNRVYCITPPLSLKGVRLCVFSQYGNTPQLETKCIRPQRKRRHKNAYAYEKRNGAIDNTGKREKNVMKEAM